MIESIQKAGYDLVAMDVNGKEDVRMLSGRTKVVLALGNEAGGLSSQALKLFKIHCRIPIDRNKAESLNVAACGAICMYLTFHNG